MTIDIARELFDETPDAIVAVQADGGVIHWNRAAEFMFGYTSDEAMSKQLSELIVPADQAADEIRFTVRSARAGIGRVRNGAPA